MQAASTSSDHVHPHRFPEKPFEDIGFGLSGGGFRAAAYGLGVLSLLHEVKLPDGSAKEPTLLHKVRTVSSASGGTITLALYTAAVHKGIGFAEFYRFLNHRLKGEALLEKAIGILKNDAAWKESSKSRNLINAFALAYHEELFALIPEAEERKIGTLMEKDGAYTPHIREFCFNATDFYTGISFRFQAGEEWVGNKGAALGNDNIAPNWKQKQTAIPALKSIRLGDILAASSCFPLGFEPIIFPKDFVYKGGPDTTSLKDALTLNTYSWDDNKTAEENERSPRAAIEKAFADAGEFGLMDGGICDNQGLYSLLLANGRRKDEGFDLIMVSDVTSYFMQPYQAPGINTNKAWMRNSPKYYWMLLQRWWKKIPGGLTMAWIITLLFFLLTTLPLFFEGVHVSSVCLVVFGVIPVIITVWAHRKYRQFLRKQSRLQSAMTQPDLAALVKYLFPGDNFAHRMGYKVTEYLQHVELGIILQMANARARSAVTMISEVFLKHIRRLIYERLFEDASLQYRRLDNPIYKLTFTNDKSRKRQPFERRQAQESKEAYQERRTRYVEELDASCRFSESMQHVAELAYNTGTTLWFEPQQEEGPENNRRALLATGQFTTCYNLLAYTISLQHSLHFTRLEAGYQQRVNTVAAQLKALMNEFYTNPYHLCRKLEE